MKITILVFSTSGNTLKVANMLEEIFVSEDVEVQILELSKRDIFSSKNVLSNYLMEHVEPHDVLCIGSPVYNGHLQYNVKDVILALPRPDSTWGRFAVPFVTWGGVQTGVALYEAASLLKKSGRKAIAGMEINAEHQMTRDFSKVINQGLPSDEALPVVRELVERVMAAMDNKSHDCSDINKEVEPGKISEKIKAALTVNERFFQRMFFPDPVLESVNCIGCGSCVSACPVQRLTLTDGKSVAKQSAPACIHCYECVRWCPHEATSCDKLAKFEKFFSKMAQPQPLNTIYPRNGCIGS